MTIDVFTLDTSEFLRQLELPQEMPVDKAELIESKNLLMLVSFCIFKIVFMNVSDNRYLLSVSTEFENVPAELGIRGFLFH